MFKETKKVIVQSDKTDNWYLMDRNVYIKERRNLITKDYRKMSQEEFQLINLEAAQLASQLNMEWKVNSLSMAMAFITINPISYGWGGADSAPPSGKCDLLQIFSR